MTTIVTRTGKGSPLTHVEVDSNFTNLNTAKLETAAIPLGTAAAPSISFLSDADSGLFSPGANQVAVATNGTSRLSINASGNVAVDTDTLYVDAVNNRVGIGTTVPTELLHVQGNLTFAGTQSSPALIKANGGTDNAAIAIKAGASAPEVTQIDIYSGWNGTTHAGGRIGFKIANTECARIDDSGRLLVGTSTAVAGSFAQLQCSTTVNLGSVATHADNTAATAAGLAVGDVYKTVLGALMIRF